LHDNKTTLANVYEDSCVKHANTISFGCKPTILSL